MSMNIPNTIVDISDVSVVTHIDRLGPRQRSAFVRAAITGIITSGGLPARLAGMLRANAGLPRVFCNSQEGVAWYSLDGLSPEARDAVFTALRTAITACMLDDPSAYQVKMYGNALAELDKKSAFGRVWVYTPSISTAAKVVKSCKLALPQWEGPVPARLHISLTSWGGFNTVSPAP